MQHPLPEHDSMHQSDQTYRVCKSNGLHRSRTGFHPCRLPCIISNLQFHREFIDKCLLLYIIQSFRRQSKIFISTRLSPASSTRHHGRHTIFASLCSQYAAFRRQGYHHHRSQQRPGSGSQQVPTSPRRHGLHVCDIGRESVQSQRRDRQGDPECKGSILDVSCRHWQS
jgi:hypothetical protein